MRSVMMLSAAAFLASLALSSPAAAFAGRGVQPPSSSDDQDQATQTPPDTSQNDGSNASQSQGDQQQNAGNSDDQKAQTESGNFGVDSAGPDHDQEAPPPRRRPR